MVERLTKQQALAFWEHPSQQLLDLQPELLPEDSELFKYYAEGPLCGLFHPGTWPGVWVWHIGVKPHGWGKLLEPARAILEYVWNDLNPDRLTTWCYTNNRGAVAMCRRMKFHQDGQFPTPKGEIVMYGWTPAG
jgi:hypothetical protein